MSDTANRSEQGRELPQLSRELSADRGSRAPKPLPNQSNAIKPAKGVKPRLISAARQRREESEALIGIQRAASAGRNDLRPTLRTEYIAIGRIRQADRRTRRRLAQQIARIRNSLEAFGACRPILVDGQLQVIDGHTVLEAAIELGWEEIPVIVVDHLPRAKVRLLAIALNRTAELGQWDEHLLGVELEELIGLGEEVQTSGFEASEIDHLVLLSDEEDLPAQDDIPELAEVAASRMGDVWKLDRHRVVQGDARDPLCLQKLMLESELVRVVLTDVPFNVPVAGHVSTQAKVREFAMASGEMSVDQFGAFNLAWMQAALPHLMDGGLLATFIDWRSVELVLASGRGLGLELLNLVVWSKTNAGQGSLWRSQHELLPVFKFGTAAHINNVQLGKFGRWRTNVWSYPGASSLGSEARDGLSVHPTVKPTALLVDALLDISCRGEIVLDPFSGSGSTLMAAEQTGRVCRAVEIDSLYCDVIIRRWENATGSEAVLEETGETFTEAAARRQAEEAR